MQKKEIPRPHRVNVRLSPEEYSQVAQYSRELAITPAEYLRRLSTKKPLPKRGSFDRDAQRQIWREIHAIGNNLNQLTHNSNKGFPVDIEHLQLLREEFQTMMRKIFTSESNNEHS